VPRASGLTALCCVAPLPVVVLNNGNVLLVGGTDAFANQPLASAEIYATDPIRAFVPDGDTASVTVVDAATNTVVGSLAAGSAAGSTARTRVTARSRWWIRPRSIRMRRVSRARWSPR